MTKINNKQTYYAAMAEIERYLEKGFAALSSKEEEHLEQLSRAVESWELKEYPMPVKPSFPDILTYLIQYKKYSQTDLSNKLSISNSLLSSILSGKKQPNLEVVINLHKTFDIDANILIESIAGNKEKNIKKRRKVGKAKAV
jgi:antitoxin component HigA of HigAB toxin-antitoxin module